MEIKRATCIKTLDMIYGFFLLILRFGNHPFIFLALLFLLHQNRTKHFANYIIMQVLINIRFSTVPVWSR